MPLRNYRATRKDAVYQMPLDLGAVRKMLGQSLQAATGRVIIIVDGVDGFLQAEEEDLLACLPDALPRNVGILLSTHQVTPALAESLQRLSKHDLPVQYVRADELRIGDTEALVANIMERLFGLSPSWMAELAARVADCSPLVVELACRLVQLAGLTALPASLDVESLVTALLDYVEAQHPRSVVATVLGLGAVAWPYFDANIFIQTAAQLPIEPLPAENWVLTKVVFTIRQAVLTIKNQILHSSLVPILQKRYTYVY